MVLSLSYSNSTVLSLKQHSSKNPHENPNFKPISFTNLNPFPMFESYSSILQRCASGRLLPQGKQIHAHILKNCLLSNNVFISTKLVFMYGKCGNFLDARKLFDEMLERSIFSWNALIGAYVSSGNYSNAIDSYVKMWVSGVMPDACTCASVLKACGACEDHDCGSMVHSYAIKCGFDSTVFVLNALIAMYSKCGRFDCAKKLFQTMSDTRDVVTWNSIINACLQDEKFYDALYLFREMSRHGVEMSSYTIVGALQACTELLYTKLGMAIHALILKSKAKFEIYETNALLVMYSKSGLMESAIRVYSNMENKDNVSWNSMLSMYVHNCLYEEAIEFFNKMLETGFELDKVSVTSITSTLGRLGRLRNGKEMHAFAIKSGFDSELHIGNTLMDMYTKCSSVGYAELVFNRMPTKDYVSWTTAIAAYSQSSRYIEALQLFREVQRVGMKADPMMIGSILLACSGLKCSQLLKQIHGHATRHCLLDLVVKNTIIDVYGKCKLVSYASRIFRSVENKDLVSWTSMISCYISNSLFNEALNLSRDMIKSKIDLDEVALVSILASITGLSSLRKGKEVQAFAMRKGLNVNASISNSLVDMYARCGNIDTAFKIFDRLETKDLVLWTTMINVCGLHGQGKEAIQLFNRMMNEFQEPDHVAFLAILYACSHSGLYEEGKSFFNKMIHEYKLDPWPEHYACAIDLLGRSGRLNEASEFIQGMNTAPTPAMWCALIGACRVHMNHELAGLAAKNLLELEPENPGNYVLISNVFSSMKKWEEAENVRMKMEDMGLKKEPACTWIELKNKVHTFVARDSSHVDSDIIYAKLDDIISRLEKESGYIADTSFVLHNVREDEKVRILHGHSERLAIAFGLIHTNEKEEIRIFKNLRVCGDCHEFTKHVSKVFGREIVVRDANRFHHFRDGCCSCRDFW